VASRQGRDDFLKINDKLLFIMKPTQQTSRFALECKPPAEIELQPAAPR
jgi:hypothetical protein